MSPHMLKTRPARPLAVLAGVQLPGVSDEEHAADLAELARLVKTLGYDAVATVSQRREGLASGTVLGTGKLKELAQLTGGSGVVASGAQDRTSKARERWEAEDASADSQRSRAFEVRSCAPDAMTPLPPVSRARSLSLPVPSTVPEASPSRRWLTVATVS